MIEARVKETYQWNRLTAFAGREYVNYEWRPVPDHAREEALTYPFLDIRIDGVEPIEPDAVKTAVPIATPKKVRKPRRKPQRKVVKNDG